MSVLNSTLVVTVGLPLAADQQVIVVFQGATVNGSAHRGALQCARTKPDAFACKPPSRGLQPDNTYELNAAVVREESSILDRLVGALPNDIEALLHDASIVSESLTVRGSEIGP